jgi:hypothetical protein
MLAVGMRHIAVSLALAAQLGAAGCALVRPPRIEVPPGPRTLREATPQERFEYLRRAQVWHAIPTASLDLLAGPPGDDAFAFEQPVSCDLDPNVEPGGATPKFYCVLQPGDTVKVKYGQRNGEVYGEVVGTRLFWALGFGTDRQYPVRVTCRGCSADPWHHPQPEPGSAPLFHPAILERKAPGKAIEVKGAREGWAWWELRAVDERVGGAPRAHVDALRLLAAFVQHTDNKDDQQTLACLPEGEKRDAAGNETCARPVLLVTDLGATFSRADIANKAKFELRKWADVPVWLDRQRCVAKLKRSWTGTLGNPRISEAGRAFLAERLSELSDRQLHDLFTAARADLRGERMRDANGVERAVTVADWVAAFRRKRVEVVETRCPE